MFDFLCVVALIGGCVRAHALPPIQPTASPRPTLNVTALPFPPNPLYVTPPDTGAKPILDPSVTVKFHDYGQGNLDDAVKVLLALAGVEYGNHRDNLDAPIGENKEYEYRSEFFGDGVVLRLFPTTGMTWKQWGQAYLALYHFNTNYESVDTQFDVLINIGTVVGRGNITSIPRGRGALVLPQNHTTTLQTSD